MVDNLSENIPVKQKTILRDYHHFALVRLPDGWAEVKVEQNDFDLRSIRKFSPVHEPKVQLLFMTLGRPIDAGTAERFANLIEAAPLVMQAEEIRPFHTLMGDMSHSPDFKLIRAGVETLGSHKGLFIEGDWLSLSLRNFSLQIYFGDEEYENIQFLGPANRYDFYLPKIKDCLTKIVFKE